MWLFIGDLHLTDRAQDAYRFNIFDWIRQQQFKHPVVATFLAGDITDQKDRHSATLVNKIVTGLLKLQPPVYIVMGNHDYRDPKNPFFKFLNHIEGIYFVVKPWLINFKTPIALIPHYRTQDEFDQAVKSVADQNPAAFLTHQTFEGAIAESGVRLSGLSASLIESLNPPLGVYAGDVHRPQTQGIMTYLGCPYQVRFGDDFEPRCIFVSKTGTESYLWFDAPRKWSLTVQEPDDLLNNSQLMEGDQIKLAVKIPREEALEWKRIKQEILTACKELKLEVFGVKLEIQTSQRTRLHLNEKRVGHVQILEQFCKAERVTNLISKTGKDILDGN